MMTSDLLKNFDQTKVREVNFSFNEVAEDIWDDLLKEHDIDAAFRIISSRKVA